VIKRVDSDEALTSRNSNGTADRSQSVCPVILSYYINIRLEEQGIEGKIVRNGNRRVAESHVVCNDRDLYEQLCSSF
jgi:hypothetical protein